MLTLCLALLCMLPKGMGAGPPLELPRAFLGRKEPLSEAQSGQGRGRDTACSVKLDLNAPHGMVCVESKAHNEGYIARVKFSPAEAHPSLFAQLRLHTNHKFDDLLQMKAAGFAEGYVTADQIYAHWVNTEWWLNNKVNNVSRIYEWFDQHDMWLTQQLGRMSRSEAKRGRQGQLFWQGMQLVMAQFDGILAGYNVRVAEVAAARVAGAGGGGGGGSGGHRTISGDPDLKPLDRLQLIILNSMGDMDDVIPLLFPPKYSAMSAPQLRTHLASSGHCSALVKVTGDLSDLLMGHVTWWTYTATSRVYKHWNFNLRHPHLATGRISHSSYPGMVSSMDDWYVLGSKMVVMETSNDVFSRKLYLSATPKAALSWQRVRVAHFWAADGPSWVSWLKLHNSGTYNNQYMVVDLKRFQPKHELQPGLLIVAEQIPGDVVWADVTEELERGHWPSYNIPYFRDIYNRSGYPEFLAAQAARGPEFHEAVSGLKYQVAPRANIFRRDSGGVGDLEAFKALLRYNNYSKDPYSGGSSWHTICSRGDLDSEKPDADGCSDGKVSSYHMAMEMAAEAVNSPPFGADLPPFAWEGRWEGMSHRGLPEVYKGEWEVQKP